MTKKDITLYCLYMLFAAMLVCSNVIATKQIPLGNWFGYNISITIGIITYPVTFLITDIIGENWGKKEASIAVMGGFIAQIICTLFIVLANILPGSDSTVSSNFNAILGSNWILTIGSLVACLVSQSWDVWIFHKLRDAYIKKHGSTKGGRWIWNNIGTISSQLIDSIIFYCGLLIMLATLGVTISFQQACVTVFAYWCIKTVIAICDTPIFYLCTNKWGKDREHASKE